MTQQTHSLSLSRFIEASPETVFAILATEEGLSNWMEGQAEFDPSPGSPFTIRFPQFATIVSGSVLEVVPSRRLKLAWGVSEGPQAETLPTGSTVVQFDIEPEDGGCRVTLTHSDLPSEEERSSFDGGWRFHLTRLQVQANQSELAEPLRASWEAWCAAWTEQDDAQRAALLERCCVEDFAYADAYATLEDRATLSLHIANTLRYISHARLEGDGERQICRGEVLIPWRGVAEDDSVAFRGTIHAKVRPDGRFERMVSFWSS